jgi:hypothetical protein
MTIRSTGRSTVTRVKLTDGQEFLLVQIEIECPVCGAQQIEFHGHHLRMIRDMVIEAIDLHPDLTGEEEVQTLSRLQFRGPGPSDPTKN